MANKIDKDLKWAHPLVGEWFTAKFGTPTEPQRSGWPEILRDRDTLISAPTGSGKTFAAFLACIDKLVRKAVSGKLEHKTEVLYVSPLKALSNDIQKNLQVPLDEIIELASASGIEMDEIRTFVRTGDTLASDRNSMLKKPPHILVTTPESLYILLTAEKSRAILKDVRTVIVDEIHAVADDKRGSHLSLSLARLDALTDKKATRIGLSATQKPIEEIAQFLVGSKRKLPMIVNVGHKRELDVAVEVPGMPLGAVAAHEMWGEVHDRVAELVKQHRSTLIFVNTRKMAERTAHHLAERLGEEFVAAHHGSLSRKLRLAAETKLKNGELKVLVATASLELGIDVGTIDLVCQFGSPRSIAVALQRVGRAGHWRGAIPKGRIFPTTRDELLECAALVRSIQLGELDRLIIPQSPLDVLAQQIVASCATADFSEDELYKLCKSAYPYRDLSKDDFYDILEMLTEGFEGRSARHGSYLHWDKVNKRVKARRGARLAAITSGGAIPETGLFAVVAEPEGLNVGTLDEDFAVESNAGDIILLGNTSWRIRRVESARGRVLVTDAHGAAPTIPFWRGEAPARTTELSAQVAYLRETISDMLPEASPVVPVRGQVETAPVVQWLHDECGLDEAGAEQAIEYILQGRAVLGAVPTQKRVIAERFFDESGGMQLVIHAPFGGRINKAWGLALRKRFCRSFNLELQAAATEDGLNIALSEKHSFPLEDIFQFLHPETVEEVVTQAAFQSPIFGTRFRWDATRALALLRFRGGKKVPPQVQRMRAEDLLASVFPDAAACQDNVDGDLTIPDHPLVKEVMKDVLTEAMDIEGLKEVLKGIGDGSIECRAVDTPVPSQFSHEILNANPYAYLDDAPLEERRARAVEMRRTLPESVLQEVGRLDQEAIAQVVDEAWPDVRDADELHDILQTMIVVPESFDGAIAQTSPADAWKIYFHELSIQRRAVKAICNGRTYWVAAEKAKSFSVLFPNAKFEGKFADIEKEAGDEDALLFSAMKGWLMYAGPITGPEIEALTALLHSQVERGLLKLESSGQILRGKFRDSAQGELEWCDRRLLARIHRLTVGKLRKAIEPVTAAIFMRWLTHWQHLAPGSQVAGQRGLLEVLKQLQGFEVPANAWERQILARRVSNYDPSVLDHLCLTGAVGWGRLSPHPAIVDGNDGTVGGDGKEKQRRVTPTSVAPITFFVREEADWLSPHHPESQDGRGLSSAGREVCDYLRLRGASFFTDIVRGTGRLKSEIEAALWELVTAGLVTADGFDNLRSLIDPRRRSGQGHARNSRPRNAAGRWTLLYTDASADHNEVVEATCWMLLKRYGIVFRDVLARETGLPRWRELLIAFRRLEDRGEVRGGRFVSGFLGEQFALPMAVESVRAMRKREPTGQTLTLSAADPLNLVGIIVPGDKVAAVSSKTVSLVDGVAKSELVEIAKALH